VHTSIGPLIAFLSSCTWALGSTAYGRIAREESAFAVNLSRGLVALPLFILTAFSGGIQQGMMDFAHLSLAQWGWFSLSMVAGYGLGDTVFLWSARSLGVPTALSIASCYPLWTSAFGAIFQHEYLSFLQILGLIFAVGGVVIVILSGSGDSTGLKSNESRSFWKGLALAIFASLLWSMNSFSVNHAGRSVPMAVGNTIRMFMAVILCLSFSKILTPRLPVLLPRRFYRSYLWLFVVEAYGGSCCFFYGIAHSPLAVGAVLVSLAPVLAVPIGWAMGIEKFSIFRSLGTCVVVLGVCLLLL